MNYLTEIIKCKEQHLEYAQIIQKLTTRLQEVEDANLNITKLFLEKIELVDSMAQDISFYEKRVDKTELDYILGDV